MRRRALKILRQVEAGHGHADRYLGADDPPFVRELVLGVQRRLLTLDTILGAFSKRPLDDLDADVRAALRVGLYQLVFLDGVPPHAVVSETVAAIGRASAKSFVNGMLRTIQRESRKVTPDKDRGGASPRKRLERPGRSVTFFSRAVFPDPEHDRIGWLAAVHSHPPLLVSRWVAALGEEQAVARMASGNVVPSLTLRPRRGRVDAGGLVDALARDGVRSEVLPRDLGDDAVIVAHGSKGVLSGSAFRRGLFSVQDVVQMDAVDLLAPRPGEVVWDLCAAPGGKTCQIAEQLAGEGRVVSTDRSAERLALLPAHVERLGLTGVESHAHDALSDEPPPGRPEAGFDAVLIDAPCSNSAVLDRRPEARWRFDEASLAELVALQERLIAVARAHLRPGGRLVYSVCSHEPEELGGHGLAPTASPFVATAVSGD